MNLIDDRWIPIRRANGSTDKIAPCEITQDIHDEKRKIIAVTSPRPDFDGALTQFLIGLLQTACTPETEDAWWDWREKPPLPDTLKVCFEPYEEAFTIYENKTIIDTKDDSKLFMQELLAGNNRAKPHPVSYLLIGAPTDNALKTNTDHFQKRPKLEEFMCKNCVAAALYTLQTYAPSGGGGGDGKATSLRGGGPLSTIILGNNLWETVWLNVIVSKVFAKRQCNEKTFPWLNIKHFISDQIQVKTIHSQEMSPEHVFWGMPRRIQLNFSALDNSETCSICGSQAKFMCHSFFDLTGGLIYQHKQGSKKRPSWINPLHPLSPYTLGENNIPSAVHQHGAIGYRYWIGFIENITAGNLQRIPAKVVAQFRTIVNKDGQLWAFGYDMDNAKARCWYEAKMPILHIDDSLAPIFSAHASNMIKASRHVSGLLLSAVLKAQMVEPKIQRNAAGYMEVDWKWPKDLLSRLRKSPTEKTKVIEEKINASVEELEARVQKSLMSLLDSVRLNFWSTTEDDFYSHLKEIRDATKKRNPEHPVLVNWLTVLKQGAVNIFDLYAEAGDFNAAGPRRVALARNGFLRSLNSNRLQNMIGLPNNANNNP